MTSIQERPGTSNDDLVGVEMDLSPLVEYLTRVCPTLLGGDPNDFDSEVNLSSTMAKLRSFCQETQVPILLVEGRVNDAIDDDDNENENTDSSESSSESDSESALETPTSKHSRISSAPFEFKLEASYSGPRCRRLGFLKNASGIVDLRFSVQSQVHIVDLGQANPVETLHSYVRHSFAPYFHSFVVKAHSFTDSARDAKRGIPGVKRKLEELEIALMQCGQNLEIPEVRLLIHPEVKAQAASCKEGNKKLTVETFGERSQDVDFLNSIQEGVNRWIREIQKITKLDRDPASGPAIHEINFFLGLETALQQVQDQLRSSEVDTTLLLLKQAHRFHATTGLDAATANLKQAFDKVKDYNQLMRDFPMNDLLTATEIEAISAAVTKIFKHMNRVKTITYPVSRAVRLVEAISRDVGSQLTKVLSLTGLMRLPFEAFEAIASLCTELFNTWEDLVGQFRGIARDLSKRRTKEPSKYVIEHDLGPLQDRIAALKRFRKQHEELRAVIASVFGASSGFASDINAIAEVTAAYEQVITVDVFDVTTEGISAWELAMRRYDSKIDRVEGEVTKRLRDRLGSARNATEMFRVFSMFNALFFRPRIRGAIQEYQTELIGRVKDDIKALQDKFKAQYRSSNAFLLSRYRDIPPVSGAVIWARQIERQLTIYMKRVEDVLGENWEQHTEGRFLKMESESFRKKLNADQLFAHWVNDMRERQMQSDGIIFDIIRKSGKLQVIVKYDPETITMFKDARNFRWMGFRLGAEVNLMSDDAKTVYPAAMTLVETIRTYIQTNDKINPSVEPLLVSIKSESQKVLEMGFRLRWDSADLQKYVTRLADSVLLFQERVELALEKSADVDACIELLSSCAIDAESFSKILTRIQKNVDELSLASYSNLDHWTLKLDGRVETVLTKRLEHAISLWINLFVVENKTPSRDIDDDDTMTDATSSANASPTTQDLALRQFVHQIKIRNQLMYLDPPLEHARQDWVRQLHDFLGIICNLPCVQSSRYEVMSVSETEVTGDRSYKKILSKLPKGLLIKAFDTIEVQVDSVQKYVDTWLQYQSLWDMDTNAIFTRLGEQIDVWESLLIDIKKSRSTFDTSDTERRFGAITIDFRLVQTKVNNKYDALHKEFLSHFGALLGQKMRSFFDEICSARTSLEKSMIESSSMGDAVIVLTEVQEFKKRSRLWEASVESFQSSERLLERQRFLFPSDWLYCSNVMGEWSALTDILSRKSVQLDEIVPDLQKRVAEEALSMDSKIKDLFIEWSSSKPLDGSIPPSQALTSLQIFDGRCVRLHEEYDRISAAKEALNLEVVPTDVLSSMLEELKDLKIVWSELGAVDARLDSLRDTAWSAVLVRKIRQALEDVLADLKKLPRMMRQYAAYESMKALVTDLLASNTLLNDLKSEALKERHWKSLIKKLRIKCLFSELTLGVLWSVGLQQNKAVIADVYRTAMGERGLEEFLRQVREYWTDFDVDMVNYHNKCYLIRGWDDLFAKVSENVAGLTSMKLSPFYKVFEEEAGAWEDKLNRIRDIFDMWIDIQRRWVYLEGIFYGSADIKNQLPQEFSRFKSIDNEFLGIMKKASNLRKILEVINIQGLARSLERLGDMLAKIQKALGDYLERQRSSFPRFYFVGDEDLLEIIGNSKDPSKIQKHLRKMFAGIATLKLDSTGSRVEGMISPEGEVVDFISPVCIADDSTIYVWLSKTEAAMRMTLATLLENSLKQATVILDVANQFNSSAFSDWIEKYPAQILILSVQVWWSEATEKALSSGSGAKAAMAPVLSRVENVLELLADLVLQSLGAATRKKCENIITEAVHQRDVLRCLLADAVCDAKDFTWLFYMRFYWNKSEVVLERKLQIRIANAMFYHGFEYLGISDRLVQTPLTDRCYLTLTQALDSRMGGSPFGPAGTGKTETVKALGQQLGRFVLVFNCDEHFDLQAMGRIFVGLCQCGAWGCFDEFNRLEERILSACSQQILTIQMGLKSASKEIELLNKPVKLASDTGIFVTMNPGYAGRSNLPDNLKQLFRSIAMVKPDRELIAQVMLFSQGFKTAEKLASKIVPFFRLCDNQLSNQQHYDFGLRALKSVLISAGILKRERVCQSHKGTVETAESETEVMIQSIRATMTPKLVAEDIPLLYSLLLDVFPGSSMKRWSIETLETEVQRICERRHLQFTEEWEQKILQLFQIQNIHHGVMMVGPSGSGKSSAWTVLLEAMTAIDGVLGESYVIDPKALTKEELYGTLDSTTREWTDGVFTHTLRKILDNVRGESQRRHWIVFDGDVDPEWVENLNSVLDDNKLYTLPNGERLALPPNVRIFFEVQDLRYATLATVSRCGMVWFSDQTVSDSMILTEYLSKLRSTPLDDDTLATESSNATASGDGAAPSIASTSLQTQQACVDILASYFMEGGFLLKSLSLAATFSHVMEFTRLRALRSTFSMTNMGIQNVVDYNIAHPDFPMSGETMQLYMTRRLLFSVLWGMGGSMNYSDRLVFGTQIAGLSAISVPTGTDSPIIDYEVSIENQGDWVLWKKRVPVVDVESHKAAASDVVVPTIDTVRHQEVMHSCLASHKPVILCGPPGSGKTMTLTATLRAFPDYEMVALNFSSASDPDLIMKTFEQYCEIRKTPAGLVCRPVQLGKWLVVFCDEINLPEADKYGTQRVITFLRQLSEHGGYWRPSDKMWIKLERIQFVGACNPPTDPGRVILTNRFLGHAALIFVDFPASESLRQIYGTFCRALLKLTPSLRSEAEALTEAMIELYLRCKDRFTAETQIHYIFSPRELSRFIRALYEGLKPMENPPLNMLVRMWAHEGLRLFHDRLVTDLERQWVISVIDDIASTHFPRASPAALEKPILFSSFMTKEYASVRQEDLRDFVQARLRVFYEEELNVPLVVFDDVLEHILRIDRVLRQPLGHLLLIGDSGAGKKLLARFVSWMNGLSIFQIKMSRNYSLLDFEEDIRDVMRRAGCKSEKICFVFDESNILKSSFLELMNALLASGEVPGLFEGDEYTALMNDCKAAAQRDGLILDSEEELYKRFINEVQRNLHVVFSMNPVGPDFHNRTAQSPALFNRCVIDWFGEWSDQALEQVAVEFTKRLDIDGSSAPMDTEGDDTGGVRSSLVASMVHVHKSVQLCSESFKKKHGRTNYITPRHYLDFINQYVSLFHEKKSDMEEQQLHLNRGLQKLRETEQQVSAMQLSLSLKNEELERKNAEANDKLKLMVHEQQEAEEKKREAEALATKIAEQKISISQRKNTVLQELGEAQPALESAQAAVSGIKKVHLDELRSMPNPVDAVKLTLEAVTVMLGEKSKVIDWASLRSLIRKESFIQEIVGYDTNMLTEAIRTRIKTQYMSNKSFNTKDVARASKACGPLCDWVISQVRFSEILTTVQPLQDEVNILEEKAGLLENDRRRIDGTVRDLERSIAKYKEEYAVLISSTQQIKEEMERVKERVDRSVGLLASLSYESQRWGAESEAFRSQMGTVVGDVLLSSAALAYSGYFDVHVRQDLERKWRQRLDLVNVMYRRDLSLIEYLSKPDDRMKWHANSLPSDDLFVENAIMLHRFNRYPLIIDPSGQATGFLLKEYADRKITRTSFLDESFMKNLESALRFGYPIIIEDVENIDPVLNTVLNKEIQKAGGRNLIRLGDKEIDFSPAFVMFLTTHDPTCRFSPDVCGRVTFVNFTITPSSLQSQCLHEVLLAEQPEVDARRTDLLKLQGEYKVRLRALEHRLLETLNEVRGNILDDDTILSSLENLKSEATDISSKAEQTEVVMEEVAEITAKYISLAANCSQIYFSLERLSDIHFFYQFSLPFFLDIFHDVVYKNNRLNSVGKDSAKRLKILEMDLFMVVFSRVSRGLLHDDHVTFAVRLSQIRLASEGVDLDDDEMDFFLRGRCATSADVDASLTSRLSFLPKGRMESLLQLASLPAFKSLGPAITAAPKEWMAYADPDMLSDDMPSWNIPGSATVVAFRRMLVTAVLRPDRLVIVASRFVSSVFGDELLEQGDVKLGEVVDNESTSKTPLLLCGLPGYDPSHYVDDLANSRGVSYRAIAMGSPEGYEQADKSISAAAKMGSWVMLKNIHLAPHWLGQLEKRLHRMTRHDNFRLFMSMELNPHVPRNLVRVSHSFIFEPPAGVKASLRRTLSLVSEARVQKAPAERSRLYFLVAWFNAVVQERLRYCPVGWTKTYEFSEVDVRGSFDAVDTWIDLAAAGRSNIAPDRIPWKALRLLLSDSIYGGRVDNEFDLKILKSFVDQIFVPSAFDSDFELVPTTADCESLRLNDAVSLKDFSRWVDALPAVESPAWLGLTSNAELRLLNATSQRFVFRLLELQPLEASDETVSLSRSRSESSSNERPQWMLHLGDQTKQWIEFLPKVLSPSSATEEEVVADPLLRFFAREIQQGRRLLSKVRKDLQEVYEICTTMGRSTNYIRRIVAALSKDVVPREWRAYADPDLPAHEWIVDFRRRIEQLSKFSSNASSAAAKYGIWIGGLFMPEACITATRQAVAQSFKLPLEALRFQVVSAGSTDHTADVVADGRTFVLKHLAFENATVSECKMNLTTKIQTPLQTLIIRWVEETTVKSLNDSLIEIPVYLNQFRRDLLFVISLPGVGCPSRSWHQRGAALLAFDRDAS